MKVLACTKTKLLNERSNVSPALTWYFVCIADSEGEDDEHDD